MVRQQSIGIISIMEGYPWGASEALWLEMAEEALKKSMQVSVSYKHWDALPQQLKHIEEKGANLYLRKPMYIKTPLVSKVLRKLRRQRTIIKKENPFLDIYAANPDVLLINQGAFTSISRNYINYWLMAIFHMYYWFMEIVNMELFTLPFMRKPRRFTAVQNKFCLLAREVRLWQIPCCVCHLRMRL
jgi:hypothetical protein